MSSYYNYKFRTHGMMSVLKRELNHKASAKDIWKYALENYKPNSADNIEVPTLTEECVALAETPNFLFVESVKLAEAIKVSKFKADFLNLDDGIRFISYPKGFQIEGKPAQGVMFAWGSFEERNSWLNCMQFNAGCGISDFIFPEGLSGYVSFTYNSPHEATVMCRLQIPVEFLHRFIACNTYQEMVNIFNSIEKFGLPLDDDGHAYQLQICHMTLKTLIYAQAMPDKIVSGCPDKRAGNNKFIPTGNILKSPDKMHTEHGPSVVGYHFRQLRDQRYYKGEHKDKPVGSRWVFVSPHERGLRAETICETKSA